MRYSTKLFQEDQADLNGYIVHRYKSRTQWLQGRCKGIGGSDSSAVLGRNPWKTNVDLYRQKVGIEAAPDISNKEAVKYGHAAEEPLRSLFRLDHPELTVNYLSNTILQSKKHPFLLYSPDGLLVENKTGRKGILEIKTTTILQSMQREKWRDMIPENYLYQVLHGLIVTGFDFVILRAQLKYSQDYIQIREYTIERDVFQEEMDAQLKLLIKFWEENVMAKKEPALILPDLISTSF